VYFLIAFAVLVVVLPLLSRGTRKREKEAADRAAQEASLRGWKYEPVEAGSILWQIYRGRTDGISWMFRTSRFRPSRRDLGIPGSRWESDAVKLDNDVIAIWPSFFDADSVKVVNAPTFVLNLVLRPIMNALGAEPEDAERLSSLQPVEHERLGSHYLLRASNPAVIGKFLDAGAARELEENAAWLTDRNGSHLVIAVVWNRGVQIVLRGQVLDLDAISRVAKLGAALTEAAHSISAN
jgi:hypothetical protein